MDKQIITAAIISALEAKLSIALAATQRAIDAATDEETVPEHKYDTLALEASYLAHGQAMRVQECEQELNVFRNLKVRSFEEQAIAVGAYVELEDEQEVLKRFFISPCAGGLEVSYQNHPVYLLTTLSPLGKVLKGKLEGDEVLLSIADKSMTYQVVTVR
ncbi:transcription elongation factor [Vibrio sp. 404]|uniref:Transcription elongation factor n=1 Tax=Vibrio marinisediminis TaxID=2758441 RepID=A0A7W2IUQ9_9VIBR|nr:transcription elongation factor [Vibrio marinisediminis]MBA5763327.1 transcription elongation factor [Vibrio marinisediminis]